MNNYQLKGTGVALVTPFKKDFEIDFEGFGRLLKHVTKGGVDYLVVNGTTGESPTLSWDEKIQLIDFISKNNTKNLPVVLGHGGNDTRKLIADLSHIKNLNLAALLSVTPYYNKPSQQGLIRHFQLLADASPFPILLYNVPYRTATNMEATTTLELAKHENILGIKEASTDLVQSLEIIINKPQTFIVLAGDDAVTLPLIYLGAAGVISVSANYVPSAFSKMVTNALSGNIEEARLLNEKLLPVYQLMGKEGNPTSVKTGLEFLNICSRTVRPPLADGSDSLLDAFRQTLTQRVV